MNKLEFRVNDENLCSNNYITFLSVDFGTANITNYEDWFRGANAPLFYEQQFTYTTAKVKVLLQSETKYIEQRQSDFIQKCSKGVYKFDKQYYDNTVYCIDGYLTDVNITKINPTNREIELTIEGTKVGDRKTETISSSNTSFSAMISGTAETPCKFTFTYADSGAISGAIFTIGENTYKVDKQINHGDKIVIDGESYKVTINDTQAIEYIDFYAFPTLKANKLNSVSMKALDGAQAHFTTEFTYVGRWI